MGKNKLNKILLIFIVLFAVILVNSKILATNTAPSLKKVEYTEDYKRWLELPKEEREKVLQPRMYEIPKSKVQLTNPLRLARMLGKTLNNKYTLRDDIPENVIVKNQEETNSCWAFAGLSSLETNLALIDYQNGNSTRAYDFSERHLEYATSRNFSDGINEKGFNREINSGGNANIYIPYFTSGLGPVDESEMPFENNYDSISINEIKGKEVTAQIYDTIDFPSYETTEDHTQIKQQMKAHIQSYGSIDAGIHGANLFGGKYYNNETGAIYCDDATSCPIDHSVSIIGWDDTYEKEKFNEECRPQNDGAWIIKNSWGTKIEYTLSEMKEEIFKQFKEECVSAGWNSAEEIPDEFIKEACTNLGYTIEGDKVTLKIGDNGIMYISYEDVNIYKELTGIIKSSNKLEYENIYQYNEFGFSDIIMPGSTSTKVALANTFKKNTSGKEYLTQVSIYAPEKYTCKVYVNPNGTSKDKIDLQPVALKSGESETFEAGYHTLEFLNPIEITGEEFTVIVEIEGERNYILTEQTKPDTIWSEVPVETGKCFYSIDDSQWADLSEYGDSTIKAFTTSQIQDDSLKDIKITTLPNKTEYIEGQDFEREGMVVTAYYNNGESKEITDYTVEDGTELKLRQETVTIKYEDKTVTQKITVEKNTVENIKVIKEPNKTQYFIGEKFNTEGMVIEATYKRGNTEIITDYKVLNGENLQEGQTEVTIEYEGKNTVQGITVVQSDVESIKVTKEPNKTTYFEGEDFDASGMIIQATYKDSTTKEVTGYSIENGTNLKKEQTTVTINFEGKKVTQAITVKENSLIKIELQTPPDKIEYFEGEDFDAKGMVVIATYANGSTKEITDYTIEDGTNLKKEQTTVTISFEGKKVTQTITVKEKIQEKPENSNLENVKGFAKNMKAYFYTDKSKEDYALIDIEVSNIEQSTVNDKCEYYYYLSPEQEEDNIESWVKIDQAEIKYGKLTFTINTKDIKNYKELANSDVLYLYIKEVAIRNNETKTAISKSMPIQECSNIEIYLDDVKQDGIDTGKDEPVKDDTIAKDELPNTGITIICMVLIAVITVFATIKFIKYRNLKDIK